MSKLPFVSLQTLYSVHFKDAQYVNFMHSHRRFLINHIHKDDPAARCQHGIEERRFGAFFSKFSAWSMEKFWIWDMEDFTENIHSSLSYACNQYWRLGKENYLFPIIISVIFLNVLFHKKDVILGKKILCAKCWL